MTRRYAKDSHSYRIAASEAEDLAARCQAGVARTLYQLEKFDAADRAYDQIQKVSLVWPDILFEQGWNAFARQEYNRTLGKLVSYKSPALSFMFNPEIDVLRAQSFLALCLYDDANNVINEFNTRYSGIGVQVKQFVEGHARDLPAFYDVRPEARSASSIYSQDGNESDAEPVRARAILRGLPAVGARACGRAGGDRAGRGHGRRRPRLHGLPRPRSRRGACGASARSAGCT